MKTVRFVDTATLFYAMEAVSYSIPEYPDWKDYHGDRAHCDLIDAYGKSPTQKPPLFHTTTATDPEVLNSWLAGQGLHPVDFSGLVEDAQHHFSASVFHLRTDWAAQTDQSASDGLALPPGPYLYGIDGYPGDLYRIPFQGGFIYIYRPPEDILKTDTEIACHSDQLAGEILLSRLYSKGESQTPLSAMTFSGDEDLGWVMALRLVDPENKSSVRSVVLARQQFLVDIQPGYLDITIGTILGVQLKAAFEEIEVVEEQIDYNALLWFTTSTNSLNAFPIGMCLVKT